MESSYWFAAASLEDCPHRVCTRHLTLCVQALPPKKQLSPSIRVVGWWVQDGINRLWFGISCLDHSMQNQGVRSTMRYDSVSPYRFNPPAASRATTLPWPTVAVALAVGKAASPFYCQWQEVNTSFWPFFLSLEGLMLTVTSPNRCKKRNRFGSFINLLSTF